MIDVVSHDVIRLVVLWCESKDLDVFVVSNQHSFLIELKGLSEPLNTTLAKTDVLVLQLGFSLKEGRDRSTRDYSNLYGLRYFFLAYGSC